MIFKHQIESINIDPQYQAVSNKFTFEIIAQLIYPDSKEALLNLQNKIDDRIFPDLIASIFRKMYENGLTKRGVIIDALLSCSHHMQMKGFEFLGFIRKGDEVSKDSEIIEFISKWCFAKDDYELIAQGDNVTSAEPLRNIISEEDFTNSYNVFFVEQIETEINSRDTKENIDELIKKLDIIIAGNLLSNGNFKQLNLFVVSSTFHLLQLSDYVKARQDDLKIKLSPKLSLNLFCVGAENPNHFFKIYDSHYAKLLLNEVIYRNFKFCKQ